MPGKKRLFWQLYPSYLVITILCLVAVTWYASGAIRDFYMDQTASDLEARARLFEDRITSYLSPLNAKAIDGLSKISGRHSRTRLTVILPSGRVVGDSDEDPSLMDNHADRPEFMEAVKGRRGHSVRHSITLDKDQMYVAVPVEINGHPMAVVRASIPVSSLYHALEVIRTKIVLAGLVMALFAALLSLLVSRRITRPIKEIRRWAEAVARGEYISRPSVRASEEIEGLSESLNLMAGELRERLDLVMRQRNEIEAVLSSMLEGVLALDMEERVMGMNRAAGRILGCDPAAAKGRSIQEVARSTAIQEFVKDVLKTESPLEEDIPASHQGGTVLNVRGTALRDADGRRIGALMVLNDVTRLRELENMRRDFVANVSHEIRTPITAIKGFVETLREGAMENPEKADRFLGIIERHADRLGAIIEDILRLSRIERESEEGEIVRVETRIGEIIQGAAETIQAQADDRGMRVDISCDPALTARVDPCLMEQALVNLLDNAIKYGNEGGIIRLVAARGDGEVMVSVLDEGPGIEAKHLPRLFERFYRIDQARSRNLGGTGLGLAIVKHIVQAHGGRIWVESTPGKGSVFTILLPGT